MSGVEEGAVASRGPDLALARLHLRLGSLALARAELETLAGRDALDQDGLVDLAEARWRTGDIAGAGEAAVAALDDEDGPLLALVVAAEAAAARGRPTEARRLADRAMEVAAGSIDGVFAGMPRAGVWPPDAAAPPPSPTTMFDPPRRVASVVHRHSRPHEGAAPGAPMPDATGQRPIAASGEADAATIGLWEATTATGPWEAATTTGPWEAGTATDGPEVGPDLSPDIEGGVEADESVGASELPTGDTELGLGRAALEAGDADEAAVRLGLVLRVAPALAPAVLDLIEGRAERGLALVRGDAYRLVGREVEARRAFIHAAGGGSWPPPAFGHEGDGDRPPAVSPDAAAETSSADEAAPLADEPAEQPTAAHTHAPPNEGESA